MTQPDLPPDLEPVDDDVLDGVFGEQVGLARRFAVHLATSGVERGLIGPREVPRLWTRHVLNCAVLGELVPAGPRWSTWGAGRGCRGSPWRWPDRTCAVTLVEPLERRTTWLTEVVEDLGIDVRVVRGRAEDVAGTVRGQVVTARAVAALDKLARWSLPLVEPGGQVLAIKGRSADEELAGARAALRRRGVVEDAVLTCGERWLEVPTTVVRLRVGRAGRRARALTGAVRRCD